jgi:hypothetical protein
MGPLLPRRSYPDCIIATRGYDARDYFTAPWGMTMELASYPRGMAYEADAKEILWRPVELASPIS